jgi:hypothetical protein
MSKAELIGPELPNIPWEGRPQERSEVVWRSLVLPCMTHRQGVWRFITAEQIRSPVWHLRNSMS